MIVQAMLAASLVAATGLAQVTPDAANVLTGLARAYSSMSTFRAEGTMQIEMHGPGMLEKMETPLTITLASPNEMRVQTTSGSTKTLLILKKSTLWIYMPLMGAYMKVDLPGDPSKNAQVKNYCLLTKYQRVANQAGEARILRSDNLLLNRRPADCWVIQIRYKLSQNSPGGSPMAKLPVKVLSSEGELWVEKAHHWILRDATHFETAMSGATMDTRTSMTFNKVTMDGPVAPSLFTFTPPSGAKELDLSKLLSGSQGGAN
jgi:outer membrane lipoprotein-sorting protein